MSARHRRNRELPSPYRPLALAALLLAFAAWSPRGAVSAAARYSIIDLGTLGGETYACALNDRGQVAGVSGNSAFLWTDRNRSRTSDPGEMIPLGALAGEQSAAEGLNNGGQVVGSSIAGTDPLGYPVRRAFTWTDADGNGRSEPGELRELPTPAGWDSHASAVNDAGEIAGARILHDPGASPVRRRGVRWKDPAPEDLSPWTDFHSAAAINEGGQIVGEMEGSAALWEDKNGNGGFDPHDTILLGRLHPLVPTAATAINNLGHVVGTSGAEGFLWRDADGGGTAGPGEMVPLGVLPGSGPGTVPRAINDHGQVVGVSNRRAFLWRGGRMEDLNALVPPGSGWVLEAAADINAAGQIAGWGSHSGLRRAFLLTPLAPPAEAADLSLTMTASPQAVLTGGSVTFILTVRNTGPGRATGVTVTDTLPENARYLSARSPRGAPTRSGRTVTFPIGALAPGAGVTLTLVAAAESPGEFRNAAAAQGDQEDPTPENNRVETRLPVAAPRADLTLSLRALPERVRTGQETTFVLTLRNAGPDPATSVTLAAMLPEGAAFVSTSPAASRSGDLLAFRYSRLAPGATAAARVVLRAQAEGPLVLSAEAAAAEADPDPDNNRGAAAAQVEPARADLALTASASPAPVTDGETLTVTFTATNRGPDAASGASLSWELPEGVTYLRARPGLGRLSRSGRSLTWQTGALPSRASVLLSVDLRADQPGDLRSEALLESETEDPDPANNAAVPAVNVRPRPTPASADLTLSVTTSPETVETGGEVKCTAVIRNLGPGPASGARLILTLPAGAIVVSGTPAYTRTGTEVAFAFRTLRAGAAARAALRVRLEEPGTRRFTARAAAETPDPDRASNAGAAVVRVLAPAAPLLEGAWESAARLRRGRGRRARWLFRGAALFRNSGTAPSSSTGVRFYLSTDPTYDPGDTFLRRGSVPALDPGASIRVWLRLPLSRARHRAARGQHLIAVPDRGAPFASSPL